MTNVTSQSQTPVRLYCVINEACTLYYELFRVFTLNFAR